MDRGRVPALHRRLGDLHQRLPRRLSPAAPGLSARAHARHAKAAWSKRWAKSGSELSHDRQKGVDKVAIALTKQEATPGMRVEPIEPQKYYDEARINDGDRIVFRVEDETVWFVDIVAHDQIGRYGKKAPDLF